MKATEMFKIGDRVQSTSRKQYLGTVSGFSRDGYFVRIREDNRKTIYSWCVDFWEIIPSSRLGAVQPLAPQGWDEKMPIAEAGGEK